MFIESKQRSCLLSINVIPITLQIPVGAHGCAPLQAIYLPRKLFESALDFKARLQFDRVLAAWPYTTPDLPKQRVIQGFALGLERHRQYLCLG